MTKRWTLRLGGALVILAALAANVWLIGAPGCRAAGPVTTAAAAPADATPLRIGSWNIEWLGTPVKRAEKTPQDADDLAKYLLGAKVDVLSLNEVTWDEGPDGERTNATLTKALALVREKTGQEWKHLLFPKEDKAEKEQAVGVAWNAARVRREGDPFRVPLRRAAAQKDVWRRHPFAVKFSAGPGKTDLVVIPVHMKSNVGGAELTGKVRADEARALLRSLGAVQNHFTDDDVVVLGDFNCLEGKELALTRYAANGLKDLNAGDLRTWIKSSRYEAAPFDRIFVPDDQPEFKDAVLRVHKDHHLADEAEFRRKLSDHYLVVTDVRVLDDDD